MNKYKIIQHISYLENCYGRRGLMSYIALNHLINVGAGVIDRNNTGNIACFYLIIEMKIFH